MTETISFKVDRSLLIRIDGLTTNRSGFIRAAIKEKLGRKKSKSKSAWDALPAAEALRARFKRPADKVKRVTL